MIIKQPFIVLEVFYVDLQFLTLPVIIHPPVMLFHLRGVNSYFIKKLALGTLFTSERH